jgi:hypothetical protein
MPLPVRRISRLTPATRNQAPEPDVSLSDADDKARFGGASKAWWYRSCRRTVGRSMTLNVTLRCGCGTNGTDIWRIVIWEADEGFNLSPSDAGLADQRRRTYSAALSSPRRHRLNVIACSNLRGAQKSRQSIASGPPHHCTRFRPKAFLR